MSNAMRIFESGYGDDHEIVGAAVNLAAVSPGAYSAYLEHLAEEVAPEYVAEVGQAVVNTLGQLSEQLKAAEFEEQWDDVLQADAADVFGTLDAVRAERGLSEAEAGQMAQNYLAATGEHLISALGRTMPNQREELVREVFVKSEAADRAERMQRFQASLFSAPSTDISDGLRVAGGIPKDLPPTLTDSAYAQYRAEQAIRREDELRATQARPERDSADEIKYRLLADDDERDWRSGLTDAKGRSTSYDQIASEDPLSARNVKQRNDDAALRRIASATGAKFR